MGLFSKLLFWKKKKEEASDYDEEMPEQQQQEISPKVDYGSGYMQPQPVPQQPSFQPSSEDKEFQILNDKLDIINSKLEVINQRLNNLEQRKPKEIVQRW